jgi:uncharacterized protein (TIGR00299 family) protein
MTLVAIIEPASGIAGDMMLGALLDLGLDPEWLKGLPAALKLEGVTVRIERVKRAEIACWKVDFDIPPQPHGRHLKHIRAIVDASTAPDRVKDRANRAFEMLTRAEAEVHGTTIEKVHLHEVGAVDAILDVVGTIWGLDILGVQAMHCGAIAVGDGFVEAAHGRMAVPAPAVVKLLEGLDVRSGPPESGELTTPTGAVLLRTLATRGLPATYRPMKVGYGAGTKDFKGRANVVRLILAEVDAGGGTTDQLALLACDIDDMDPEYLASAADALRDAGALDVTLLPVIMKKGRPGSRLEVLSTLADADRLEALVFGLTTTIGVRRTQASRTALPRESRSVEVFGHTVSLKVVTLPDGSTRAKPEYDDVMRVAAATGRPASDVRSEASRASAKP